MLGSSRDVKLNSWTTERSYSPETCFIRSVVSIAGRGDGIGERLRGGKEGDCLSSKHRVRMCAELVGTLRFSLNLNSRATNTDESRSLIYFAQSLRLQKQ